MNASIPEQVKIYLDQYILGLQMIYKTALDKVILYGSYARGDYTEDSDIDIMILTLLTLWSNEKVNSSFS